MSKTDIQKRLTDAGITIFAAAAPAANYAPFVQSGNLLFTAGQIPLIDGKLMSKGKLGRDLDVAAGQQAARFCAINILAQAQAALGDLSRIKRIVKITVFVSSEANFIEQHIVADGASDLLVAVLGDAGKHARSAVGVPVLPMDASVEVEATIEIE